MMRSSIQAIVAVTLVALTSADPGVSPAAVQTKLLPGDSFHVDKRVVTPDKFLPNPDIVLLVDVTGSMGAPINDIKANLREVINTVSNLQPDAQFAVASFRDFSNPSIPAFEVVQGLTSDVGALQDAVDSLKAGGGGGGAAEDWINALYEVSTGAIEFREGSTRIVILVSDQPSNDPSGGHTKQDAIDALKRAAIRVVGVNVRKLDDKGQATDITEATGGTIVSSRADAVSDAIISGLNMVDMTVKPDVVSCDAGLSLKLSPTETTVRGDATVTFAETVQLASDAADETTLTCSVRFLVDDDPGGDAFVQSVDVSVVAQFGCYTCKPYPGQNLCHESTACQTTPYGTMCLTMPGYKADGAADDDVTMHWRMEWDEANKHRVAVKPGVSATTECYETVGDAVCAEIAVAECKPADSGGRGADDGKGQVVLGEGEL